jgi:hypothetical protein
VIERWPDFASGVRLDDPRWGDGGRGREPVLAQHPDPDPPKPVVTFTPHAAANGLDICRDPRFGSEGQAFVALFDDLAPVTVRSVTPAGFKIARVDLERRQVVDSRSSCSPRRAGGASQCWRRSTRPHDAGAASSRAPACTRCSPPFRQASAPQRSCQARCLPACSRYATTPISSHPPRSSNSACADATEPRATPPWTHSRACCDASSDEHSARQRTGADGSQPPHRHDRATRCSHCAGSVPPAGDRPDPRNPHSPASSGNARSTGAAAAYTAVGHRRHPPSHEPGRYDRSSCSNSRHSEVPACRSPSTDTHPNRGSATELRSRGRRCGGVVVGGDGRAGAHEGSHGEGAAVLGPGDHHGGGRGVPDRDAH